MTYEYEIDFQALAAKIVADFANRPAAATLEEAIAGLSAEEERQYLLTILIWEALRTHSWRLAETCLQAGYTLKPAQPYEFGPCYEAMTTLGDCAEVIDWLLRHGAEIERRAHNFWTPLLAAVSGDLVNTVAVLLDHGADINASTLIDYDDTALMIAARNGNETIVTMLLNRGAEADRRNRYGQNAQELAEQGGYVRIADLIRSSQA